MSVTQYEQLTGVAGRDQAMTMALASVRAEGLEPSPQGLALLARVVSGELTTADVRAQILARYGA